MSLSLETTLVLLKTIQIAAFEMNLKEFRLKISYIKLSCKTKKSVIVN